MSCKLWLNVWTCRSFTCPFTLRNLERNPTAAFISGFIVPRAQRVCIERGDGDGTRALLVSLCVFVSTSEDPKQMALALFLFAFICRGRGKCFFSRVSVCQDGSVLRDGSLSVVEYRRCGGGPLLPRQCARPSTSFLQSEGPAVGEQRFIWPPLPPLNPDTATTADQSRAWRATYGRGAALTSPL